MATPKAIDTQPDQPSVYTAQISGPSSAAELANLPDMGAAYAGLADFGKKVEDLGVKAALPTMEAKGADAVIRDPVTNKLSVQPRLVLNALDASYNHGAMLNFAAQSELDQTSDLTDIKDRYINDPNGFRDAATAYVKAQAGATGVPPELRTPILQAGLEKVAQFRSGLAAQKAALDFKKFQGTSQSLIDTKSNELLQIANQHGVDTPEFHQLIGEVDSLYGSMQNNPQMAFSPEQHQAAMAELIGNAKVQATLGTFNVALSKSGTIKALQSADTFLHSPNLNLTPTQVHSFASQFHAMAEERQAETAHADAMSARNLKMTQDNTEKDGIELAARGGLTMNWVLANKRKLDPTAFSSLLRATTSPATRDNPATVADLMPRVYVNGDPTARDDIGAALRNGHLTPDTAAKFYNELGQSTPPDVKRWQSYLVGRMKPSTIEGKFDPDAADRMQGALEDYRDFTGRTPNATPQQLRQRADDILAIHSLGGAVSARVGFTGIQVPLIVGTLDKPNAAQSGTNIKNRYLALHGGDKNAVMADPNFQIDMRRLKEIADRANYLQSVEQGAFNGAN
jgi:hypothetical protein